METEAYLGWSTYETRSQSCRLHGYLLRVEEIHTEYEESYRDRKWFPLEEIPVHLERGWMVGMVKAALADPDFAKVSFFPSLFLFEFR